MAPRASGLVSGIHMTPAQLRILRNSFAKIEPVSDRFGEMFYERLFSIAPELRKMFGSDLKLQQAKFMKVIKEVIELHLRSSISLPITAQAADTAVIPGAFWSGKLHAAYGVTLEDFETMKTAVVWALEKTLGEDCSADVKDAWCTAYDILAGAMRPGILSPEDDDREPENQMQARLDEEEPINDEASTFRSRFGG